MQLITLNSYLITVFPVLNSRFTDSRSPSSKSLHHRSSASNSSLSKQPASLAPPNLLTWRKNTDLMRTKQNSAHDTWRTPSPAPKHTGGRSAVRSAAEVNQAAGLFESTGRRDKASESHKKKEPITEQHDVTFTRWDSKWQNRAVCAQTCKAKQWKCSDAATELWQKT